MSDPLSLLAIPTARRPAELRRAVSSFANHLAAGGQTVPIVVFHSPGSAAEQADVQAALRGTGPVGTPEASYVGLVEKLALAKDLRRVTKAPPQLLDLALFNPLKLGASTGANRNAALLWSAGQRFVSCDDDTVAEFYAHPDLRAGATLQPGIATTDPCDYLVPGDAVLDSFRIEGGDQRLPAGGLPAALGALWEAAEAAGTPAPLVFVGSSGDCGWSAPFGFFGMPLGYLQLGPATLSRLAATPEGWSAVLSSRTLLRVVPRPVLSRGTPGMTTAVGIDGREELPPFVPIGRGQDLIFCAMTERLRGAPSAHLPLAVAHRPPGHRRFREGELWRAADSFDICRTFFALLETLPPDVDLGGIGRHLEALANSPAAFEDALRSGRRAEAERLCAAARTYAAVQTGLPVWWRDDLLSYCDRTERAATNPEPLWVLDAGPNAATSMSNARALVQGYGALCQAWPALFSAARERASALRAAPARPARPPRPARPSPPADPVRNGPSRCSPFQTWVWRLHRLDPGDTSYVIFLAVRGEARLDPGLLEQSLRALAGRHHALRCRLPPGLDDEPLLDLRPPEELSLRRAGPFDEQALQRARHAERLRPFDLASELPLRATLTNFAENAAGWELWVAVHHVAFDGVSEQIFWRELEAIYQNLLQARPALHGLQPLRLDYEAVAEKQRAALTPEILDSLERHWRERLQSAPSELRVSFRTADPAAGNTSAHLRAELPAGLAADVRRLARERRVSVAALSLAAWQALVSRWSGETDVLVAVNVANRFDEIDEEQIGLFMSVLPVRADLSGDPHLLGLAESARTDLAGAWEYGRLPFDRLVRSLGHGRRRFALVHALFNYEFLGDAPWLAGAPLEPIELEEKQAGFELGLTVEETGEQLSSVLVANAALFDRGDLQRLADAFAACLAQVCGRPDLRLSEIIWLGATDEAHLSSWNRTAADFPSDQPLTALLRERAAAGPAAIALEAGDERLTYAELQGRAALVSARLRGRGVDRDAVVGVYLDRHPRLLESILGVLDAGGAYLPLDPAFPRERLAFMLEDAGVTVLVTRRGLLHELPPHRAEVVCVDDDEAALPAPAGWHGPTAASLAYVLYTSGSTGKPKGVEIPHRALVNFLCSMARVPGFAGSDALLALTTLSFDIAGLELWLPLLAGGKVVLAGREEAADGALLAAALTRSRATVMQATPTTWRTLFASGWQGDPNLKALVGGEALPPDLAGRLAESCGEAWNLYGPTESTIWSAAWRIPRGAAEVRIGRPIANTQLHVLDTELRQLPLGVTGELWIGGDGLARGYLGRPDLTAERFVPDPFRRGGRLYRTGDLARWLPDGELEFLGRADDQLKLHGYRIEPGEIEAALHQIDGVAQAAVDLHRQGIDGDRLVAYLVAANGAALASSADLRARLREHLADYLVPHHFVEVRALPLTPNGKVDRQRLDALFRIPREPPTVLASTLDALEEELVAEFATVLSGSVGPDTDFFEAGGDSLSALRLVGRLSVRQGGSISGTDLFVYGTPRRLAARLRMLRSDPETSGQGHLRLLRQGIGPPLVFVHPIGGEMLPYAQLAQQLSAGVAVFGLQALSDEPRFASLVERCAAYAEELQRMPDGPLFLGGYSLGGVLAMELAAQLRRAGREVRCVFLLDSSVPKPARRGIARLRHRLSELQRFTWGERRHWLGAQRQRFTGRGHREELMLTLGEQEAQWLPAVYEGRVLLLRCELDLRSRGNRPAALGWDAFCPLLEVVTVPGNHNEIVAGATATLIVHEIEQRMTHV